VNFLRFQQWPAIGELIKKGEGGLVMPVPFDRAPVEGVLSNDGYLSAQRREPEDVADLILDRLELNRGRRRK
jgi:hypothetical protein